MPNQKQDVILRAINGHERTLRELLARLTEEIQKRVRRKKRPVKKPCVRRQKYSVVRQTRCV